MKIVVRISMALVALAAAALSYQSLMHLGQLCGYGSLALLYPLVVDLGAAASCAAFLHTRARQPLAMTWALLVVSVLLNGTVHYLESLHTTPGWLLVVAVAAVPPAVLGLTVHLAVGLSGAPVIKIEEAPTTLNDSARSVETGHGIAPELTHNDQPARHEPLRSVPDVELDEDDAIGPAPLTGLLSADLLERARQIVIESEQTVGRNRLAKALDVSPHQARQLLAELAV